MSPQPDHADSLFRGRSPRQVLIIALGIMFSNAVFFTGAGFAVDQSNQSQYSALAEFGVGTTATVTGTEPRNHNTVHYTFQVDGTTYATGSFARPPNPSAGELRVGDTIRIVYDPRNPEDSCACDPDDSVQRVNLVGAFLGGLVLGVLPAAFVLSRRPRRPPLTPEFLSTTTR